MVFWQETQRQLQRTLELDRCGGEDGTDWRIDGSDVAHPQWASTSIHQQTMGMLQTLVVLLGSTM